MSTAAFLIGLQVEALTTSAKGQRGARPTLGDVAAHGFVRDVVRTFRLLGSEHAGDLAGGNGGRA